MEFTINCTRVPIPQGTTLYGTPVDTGPAPVSPDPASDHNAPSALNDGDTLNLTRGASPNGEESDHTQQTPRPRIVSCKKQTIISSLNTRRFGPLGRLEELAEFSKSQNIDILAIQEHRFHHSKDVLK